MIGGAIKRSTMRKLCWSVILLAMCSAGFAQEAGTGAAAAPSAIPEGEAHFTPDQLREYYLVYTDPDVRYLRTIFDAYLKGGTGHEGEFEFLKKWSSDYYRSKFMVCSRDQNPFGGTLITLMFQEKPDRIFVAWVYPSGQSQRLELRAFEPGNFTDEDIERARARYKSFLEDKDHAM